MWRPLNQFDEQTKSVIEAKAELVNLLDKFEEVQVQQKAKSKF